MRHALRVLQVTPATVAEQLVYEIADPADEPVLRMGDVELDRSARRALWDLAGRSAR